MNRLTNQTSQIKEQKCGISKKTEETFPEQKKGTWNSIFFNSLINHRYDLIARNVISNIKKSKTYTTAKKCFTNESNSCVF